MNKKLLLLALVTLSSLSPIFVTARYDNSENRDRPNLYNKNEGQRNFDNRGMGNRSQYYHQDEYFYRRGEQNGQAVQPQYYQAQPTQQYYYITPDNQ